MATNRPDRVMILGIDSPIADRLVRWANEGKLPALQGLIERGVYAPQCLVPYPTITPPNWTTIATGAWPMTHGITDFEMFMPGRQLDDIYCAFSDRDVLAERLWTALEKVGKRSVIVNYPTTWPRTIENGIQVAGGGLGITDWRMNLPHGGVGSDLTAEALISTNPYPFAGEISFTKARGWVGVEHSSAALEGEVTLRFLRPPHPKLDPVVWHILVDRSGRKGSSGYDTVVVAKAKTRDAVYTTLGPGQWSNNIYDTFATEAGPRKAVFRLKIVELSPDAQDFRLYTPGLSALDGWAHPAGIEREIAREAEGLPTGRAAWEALLLEWIDQDTFAEATEFHYQFLADVSFRLLKSQPWDFFITHHHPTDWMYHTWCRELDPTRAADKSRIPAWEALELRILQQCDRALARIMEAADERTLVVVVSDHGAKPPGPPFRVNDLLVKAGILTYADDVNDEPDPNSMLEKIVKREIVWSRTKAYAQRYVHIYLNVKGREPEGIVEPGEEYEGVRQQVINLLYDYTDPATGKKPIVLALKREDAPILGLGGPRTGDIVYAVDPYYGEEHGQTLPTSGWGIGNMAGLFIMAGPGVKQGKKIERTVRLVDVVPTICHLAEWPVPIHCEGGIIYQALEDPNGKTRELESLRRNVERLKRMVERPPMC